MGRIKGYYEWDDDALTPGRKREGGLHQNLFDQAGNLRGNARFVPDDGDPEPLVVTETVFISVEDRRDRDDELAELAANLLGWAITTGIPKAMPYVEQWWSESARPALRAGRVRATEFRARRLRHRKDTEIAPVDRPVAAADAEVAALDLEADKPSMSRAEAQARSLSALAARAFAEEQLRLVRGARLVEGDTAVELQRSLAELPREQTLGVIEAMAANPALLTEENLAQLASILGRQNLPTTGVSGSAERVSIRIHRRRGSRRNERDGQ